MYILSINYRPLLDSIPSAIHSTSLAIYVCSLDQIQLLALTGEHVIQIEWNPTRLVHLENTRAV